MKINTCELQRSALDLEVAKCEYLLAFGYKIVDDTCVIKLSTGQLEIFSPSTNWAQAGPIIERERIGVEAHPGAETWIAFINGRHQTGPTPLIAAMRCYVASQLGDEVEVPEDIGGK